MGCFNTSCGISRLSIHREEEVYLILIAKTNESDGKSECYINEMYTPVSFPIRCTYDEYGRFYPVEEHKGLANIITNQITKALVEQEATKYDKAITKENLTWDSLVDEMHDGRIHLYGQGAKENADGSHSGVSNTCIVTAFPVKKDVFEGMVGMTVDQQWHYPWDRAKLNEDLDAHIASIFRDEYDYSEAEQEKFDRMLAIIMKRSDDEEEAKKQAHEYVTWHREDDGKIFSDGRFTDVDRYGARVKLEGYLRTLTKVIKADGEISEESQMIIDSMKDLRIFASAMDWLRIQLCPPMIGTQEDNPDPHKQLASFMLKSMEKDAKRFCECECMSEAELKEYGCCEYCEDHK